MVKRKATKHWPKGVLDALIYTLILMISLLFLTGGVHYSTPNLKLELSQIDVFAWILLAFVLLRKWQFNEWLPKNLYTAIEKLDKKTTKNTNHYLFALIAIYVVLETWILVWRFDSFQANAFDLSYVDQPLWATTNLSFLYSSLAVKNSYMGEHFSPILGLVSVIYQIWDSVYILFLLQSVLLGASAIIVFKLASEFHLRRQTALLIAVCFLMYQPLRAANQFDFREDILFVPLFLGALLFAKRERWYPFWVLCVVSWTVKENAAIFTLLLGVWVFSRAKILHSSIHRGQGIAIVIASALAFYTITSLITPYFSGGTGQTRFAFRMRMFGDSLGEVIAFVFQNPVKFFEEMAKIYFQKDTFRYFLKVLTPFIYFAPFAPVAFLIGVAGLFLNITLGIVGVGFHYECVFLPFLFLGLVIGLSKIKNTKRPQVIFLVFLSFLLFYGRSPIHSIRHYVPSPHHRFVANQLKMIPKDASIATISSIHPHLTHRKDAFLIPSPKPVDYIIADLNESFSSYGTPNLRQQLRKIDPEKYEKIVDHNQFFIWKRK